jgi:homeobox protein cut-like
MILDRSKALQSDNTGLRVEKDRLTDELSSARRDLSERTKEGERQRTLIEELEDHVERLQDLTTATNRGEAEGRSSADILVDALQDLTPKQEEELFQKKGQDSSSVSRKSPDKLLSSSSDSALLPIVHAQRERFRRRNEELEETQSKQTQQIALLQTETEDLRADNVKLYEKIRFLQGFGGVGKKQISSDPSSPSGGGGGGRSDVESRYKKSYEQKLDPFNSFNNQERQKRYSQLNVFEKIVLSFVQFMMGNKSARLFVFAYAVLLHGLVFAVLMKMALNDAHRRDVAAEWQDKYVNHMDDAHGGVAG